MPLNRETIIAHMAITIDPINPPTIARFNGNALLCFVVI